MSEPLTQAQFYDALMKFREDLYAYIDEKHGRLRDTVETGLTRVEVRIQAHERDDQLIAKDVAILKDARREEQRRSGLRTTWICAIATASATLTMGLLRLLKIL
jgi:hypothetical protein